jgi:hypothetical protein
VLEALLRSGTQVEEPMNEGTIAKWLAIGTVNTANHLEKRV